MRIFAIFLAVMLLGMAALSLASDAGIAPSAEGVKAVVHSAIAGVALLLVLAHLFWRPQSAPASPPAFAAVSVGTAPASGRVDAEIVSFLGLLQEKGRLIDFLMDDIAGYADADVGAAGRVLHEGCKAVLKEHFDIRPLRAEAEGSKVVVPAGYPADEYRLVGRIAGEAPFTGTLVHHGWKTDWVKLPRLIVSNADRPPVLAPAEVELK